VRVPKKAEKWAENSAFSAAADGDDARQILSVRLLSTDATKPLSNGMIRQPLSSSSGDSLRQIPSSKFRFEAFFDEDISA